MRALDNARRARVRWVVQAATATAGGSGQRAWSEYVHVPEFTTALCCAMAAKAYAEFA